MRYSTVTMCYFWLIQRNNITMCILPYKDQLFSLVFDLGQFLLHLVELQAPTVRQESTYWQPLHKQGEEEFWRDRRQKNWEKYVTNVCLWFGLVWRQGGITWGTLQAVYLTVWLLDCISLWMSYCKLSACLSDCLTDCLVIAMCLSVWLSDHIAIYPSDCQFVTHCDKPGRQTGPVQSFSESRLVLLSVLCDCMTAQFFTISTFPLLTVCPISS